MLTIRPLARIALVSLALSAPAYAQQPVSHELPASFADLVEKLSPAVVNISTTQKVKGGAGVGAMPFGDLPDTPEMEPFREFFDRFGKQQGQNGGQEQERELYSLGSGFIIDPSGFIITNYHVVEQAEDVNVTLPDNTKYKAKVIGRDKKTDLALLKVEPKKPLPFVPLGDSESMRVGDWVIAIGNPYGLGGSVTQGIISARQRSINAGPFDDFLQTDAPINRGNSGGPLFNMKGEVIGINSAIFSPSGGSIGIGFAIPTVVAKPVIAQLKEFGRTHRGWLGVKIQEVTEEAADSVGLPKQEGALVLEVSKGSPADKVGIQPGDVITNFNGKEISEMRFLPRMVAETKIGSTVPITFWRANASQTVQITLGELDESADEADAENVDKGKKAPTKKSETQSVVGMDVGPLTPKLRDELHIDDKLQGLAVVNVKNGSEAAKQGMKPGDVIESVNNQPVKSVAELRAALAAAQKAGHKYALAKVAREKDVAFVTLPTTEEKPEKKDDKSDKSDE